MVAISFHAFFWQASSGNARVVLPLVSDMSDITGGGGWNEETGRFRFESSHRLVTCSG